jgi:FAD/FMN-containing dehydrogenase
MEERSGAAVEGFEVMPQATLDLVLAHVPGTRAPLDSRHRWHVLIEFVQEGAQAGLEELLAGAMETGLIETATVSTNDAQADAFWRLRDSISEAERASGPAIQHDISVAVDAMPDFMTQAVATIEREFPQVTSAAFGHLGDGNVHLHVRAPAGIPDAQAWRAGPGKAASRRVYDLVVAAGGSISAEHGIGQMKLDELARLSDPARLAMMRAIKTAFDPQGIMNPGKLVPLAPNAPDA